jgi:hypothetical protein
MNARVLVFAALCVTLFSHSLFAQDISRYRAYPLGSSLASVVKLSGARTNDLKTLHERPAMIQELEWLAPFVLSGSVQADPVRDVKFTFYNDQLFRIVVSYDRNRMEGLTNDDVIESISAMYGVPVLSSARTSRSTAAGADAPAETAVLAQWEDTESSVTLVRGTYSLEFRLVLISRSLHTQAQAAIREALRLDAREAPQREMDQRKKAMADARTAQEKARVVNKAAFKP